MSARRGWKEPVEDGIRRSHRTACPRSSDQTAGRKCGCPFEIKVPGRTPRSRTSETVHGTLTEARQRRRLLLSMGRPERTDERADITVHDHARDWLRGQQGYAASTLDSRARACRLHILPHIGGIEVQALTTRRLVEWVQQMKESGAGHRAMELAVTNLHAMLNIAVRDGLIEHNPAKGLRVGPAPARRERAQHVLTVEQYESLLRACRDLSEDTMMRCAVEGMLRRGEITALQWCDVDFAAKRIHVRTSAFQDKRGKHIKSPKSGKSREVVLGPEAWRRFTLYRQEAVDAGAFGPTAHVWPGRGTRDAKGGIKPFEIRSPDSVTHLTAKIMRRAGLVDHRGKLLVTLHGLRKTGGSIALNRGVPMIVVQHQMGHANVTTTAAHYAFMLDGQELDRIGDVFADLDRSRSAESSVGPGRL